MPQMYRSTSSPNWKSNYKSRVPNFLSLGISTLFSRATYKKYFVFFSVFVLLKRHSVFSLNCTILACNAIVALIALTLGALPVAAQSVTASVNPATYNGNGQTLTFTYNVNSGVFVVTSFTINSSIAGIAINCGALPAQVNASTTCTGTYTTAGNDGNPGGFVQEVGNFNMTGMGGVPLNGQIAGNARANNATKADQTITFNNPGTQTFAPNGAVGLNATGGNSGNPVTFSTNTPAICTINGNTARMQAAGLCSITANQAGNVNHNPAAPQTQTFTINQASQTITFTDPGAQTFTPNGAVALNATGGGSGNAVVFVSTTPTVCTVAGSTATIMSVGNCSITASQAGDANYLAAPDVIRVFAVNQGGNTITFVTAANVPFHVGSVNLTATASSGLTVTYVSTTPAVCTVSGTTLTLVSVGTCSVTAAQAGDANYVAAANVVQIVTVGRGDNTISFAEVPDTPFSAGTLSLTASATSGLVVIFRSNSPTVCTASGNVVTLVATGTCMIIASQPGDSNYSAASNVTRTFSVILGDNTITFDAIPDTPLISRTVQLSAAASSGLAVAFRSNTPAVCTTSGTTASLVWVGTCSITASQAGNAFYKAAEDVTRTFTVNGDGVAERTQRLISNFMVRRADQITANDPDLSTRLTGTLLGSLPFGFTAFGTESNYEMAYSTSLRKIADIRQRRSSHEDGASGSSGSAKTTALTGSTSVRAPDVLNSSESGGSDPTGVDVWLNAKWAHANDETRESDFGLMSVGIDYRFNPNLLFGVLTQFDWSKEVDGFNQTAVRGTGWLVGPYAVARLSENLIFDARAAWGRSNNRVDPLGLYEDDFDTTRWLASVNLTGDFSYRAWRFMPHAKMTYFEENQRAYTDSLGIPIPKQTVSLGRLQFGPKISYLFTGPDGTKVSPHVSLDGIWDFSGTGIVDIDTGAPAGTDQDFRARLQSGVKLLTGKGWSVVGEGFYDGIGIDGLDIYGGRVQLTLPLR